MRDIVIRRATAEDAEALGRVHVESWLATYAGLLPPEFLAARTGIERRVKQMRSHLARPERIVFVVEHAGKPSGFAVAGPIPERPQDRDPLPGFDAYLHTFYLLPEIQGRGVGRALLAETAHALAERGLHSLALHVLATNKARAFYEHLGAHHLRDEEQEGQNYDGVGWMVCAYGWPDTRVLRGERNLSRAHALAALAGASALGLPRSVSAQAAPISMGVVLADAYLEPSYAQDQGFFKKAGLNVTLQTFANAALTLQAVAANALDVGTANLIQLASAYNRGVDVTIIASGGMYTPDAPTLALFALKSSAYQAPKDFEGQTIGITNMQGTESIAVSEWLKQGGADPTKVKLFELPFSAMAPALIRGTIAAGSLGDPFVSEAGVDLKRVGLFYGAIAPTFYTGVWVARRSRIAQDPATFRSLVNTIYATAQWANTHPNDTAVTLAGLFKTEPAKVRAMLHTRFATSLEPRYAQPLLDVAYKYKLLDKPVDARDLFWSQAGSQPNRSY